MYKTISILRLVLICVIYFTTTTHQVMGQTLIDTFSIKDEHNAIGAHHKSYIYEDEQYYYYFVNKKIINISTDVVDGEIVYEYEYNELKYSIGDEIVETRLLPSKIDTNYGNYLTLIKFTKDFKLIDYANIQNVSESVYTNKFIEDFKISEGKLHFVVWSSVKHPLVINEEEIIYSHQIVGHPLRYINSLVVLDQNLDLVDQQFFPEFMIKGLVPKSGNQIIFGAEIRKYFKHVVIGMDTIFNNKADYSPNNLYRENVVISLYDYGKDSSIWSELISNDFGVQIKHIEENYNRKEFYIHIAAGGPFVYIGTEYSPKDSVRIIGEVNDLDDYYRDHLLMKFDDKGNFESSIGIPEGLFDRWRHVEIDNIGNIYLSLVFSGEEITIRDSVYVNEYVKNGGTAFSSRNGLVKFDSLGVLQHVKFFDGEYVSNNIFRMVCEDQYVYLLNSFEGNDILVSDSLVTSISNFKEIAIRIEKSNLEAEVIYDPVDRYHTATDILEVTEDTIIFVGNIFGFEYFSERILPILKVQFRDVVLNNLSSYDDHTLIRVYPNPVMSDATIMIDYSDFNIAPGAISIIDLNGKIQSRYSIIGNTNNIKINIPELNPGMYFIVLSFQDKQIIKQLVVL